MAFEFHIQAVKWIWKLQQNSTKASHSELHEQEHGTNPVIIPLNLLKYNLHLLL